MLLVCCRQASNISRCDPYLWLPPCVLHPFLLELIKHSCGTGRGEQNILRRKLVFQKHYHNLVHNSASPHAARIGPEQLYLCIFAIIRKRTAGRYRNCQEGWLFLTAGAWPWSLFSLPLIFFFVPQQIVTCGGWASVLCPCFRHMHCPPPWAFSDKRPHTLIACVVKDK